MLTYLIVAVGSVLLACWWMLTRTSKRLRNEFQTEIDQLSNGICELKGKLSEPTAGNGDLTKVATVQVIAPKSTESLKSLPEEKNRMMQISPESLDAIKATLAAFLGQKVRIRSVKLLGTPDPALTWVTQGRIAIQTSHDQYVGRG
jgi:hypothetical protein